MIQYLLAKLTNRCAVLIKGGKACRPDGVPPRMFKHLPATWLLCIIALFNILMSATYPSPWVTAKLFTVFKRGSRALVNNYRGISVINSIKTLYDMVLCDRLNKWFKHREQAGSQAGRCCLEHIVTLRLLTDVARRKKFKLFITFVDFTCAYANVPRNILFYILKRLWLWDSNIACYSHHVQVNRMYSGNSNSYCLDWCASGLLHILLIVRYFC